MAKWQIFSAVALRRLPHVVPRLDLIEQKVKTVFDEYELYNSRLSAHEMQHLQDLKTAESKDLDVIVKETAQDKEDKWNKEIESFKFSPYDDRLTKIHYLFFRSKLGTDIKDQWLLPQALYKSKEDKNLVDTAQRALAEHLNIINGYRIVSKIPSSVHSFEYSRKVAEKTGYYGARIFFLKANLEKPSKEILEVLDDSNNENLKWLTKDEAAKVVEKSYMKRFSQGLFHEDRVDINLIMERAKRHAESIKSGGSDQLQQQHQSLKQ